MKENQLIIKPITVLAVPKNSEGWLTTAQVAEFFGISARDVPQLLKMGLEPPVKINQKVQRFALQDVMNFSKNLRKKAKINYNKH